MNRQDYAFPFRIDPGSQQGALAASYPAHVDQMIRQILLTDPGERADLPDFGCGLRRLIFAPNSDALAASTKILIQQSLTRWLSGQITVQNVSVASPELTADAGVLQVTIEYLLIETQTPQFLEMVVQ
jgi:phage baseplate assembly protein W